MDRENELDKYYFPMEIGREKQLEETKKIGLEKKVRNGVMDFELK